MSKAYFMGIDTGTNSSKGVIMDDCGQILAVHSTQHEMTNPKPGHYEHDAEKDWWGDFCTISKALIAKTGIDPKDIRAVGASALGADCLPVDEHCNPLRKAILYGIDARATDEMAQLTELYGDEQIRFLNACLLQHLHGSTVAPNGHDIMLLYGGFQSGLG
jgi:xylulokinase